MNVKIADLMAKQVITSQPHHTIDHVRKIMQRNRISAVPIVNGDDEPLGIITSSDLGRGLKGSTPVSSILQPHIHQVPAYNDISVAAKVMRKNKIHHLLVTHEGAIVCNLLTHIASRCINHLKKAKNPGIMILDLGGAYPVFLLIYRFINQKRKVSKSW